MRLSNPELVRLCYLECIDGDGCMPDGCDGTAFESTGLIELIHEKWCLTGKGRRNLLGLQERQDVQD